MKNPGMLAKKIARGINFKYGSHICINVSEFYGTSAKNGVPNLVRMYVVRDAYCGQGGVFVNKELYKSGSAYNVLFFMRDLLFRIDKKELPEDNAQWEAEKMRKNALAAMDYIIETYVEDIVE